MIFRDLSERLTMQWDRGLRRGFRLESCQYIDKAESSHETGPAQPGVCIKKKVQGLRPKSFHV